MATTFSDCAPGASCTVRTKPPSAVIAASAPATTTVTLSALSDAAAVPRTVTEVASVTSPSVGSVMVREGGVLLACTCSVRVSLPPAASVSTSSSVLGPCTRGRSASKLPSAATATARPFTVSTTGVVSVAVPRTFTTSPLMRAPSAGLVTTSFGACESRVTETLAFPSFPAASSADTENWLAPSIRDTVRRHSPSAPFTRSSPPTRTRATGLSSTIATTSSTWDSRVSSPLVGDCTVSTGLTESIVKARRTSRALPAWSTALTTSSCGPSADTVPPLGKSAPSSFASTVPGFVSSTVYVSTTGGWTYCPSVTPETDTCGGTLSSSTGRQTRRTLPHASRAVATSALFPGTSGTLALHAPPSTLAITPLMSTRVAPGPTVPVTSTGDDAAAAPSAGEVSSTACGDSVSTSMKRTCTAEPAPPRNSTFSVFSSCRATGSTTGRAWRVRPSTTRPLSTTWPTATGPPSASTTSTPSVPAPCVRKLRVTLGAGPRLRSSRTSSRVHGSFDSSATEARAVPPPVVRTWS